MKLKTLLVLGASVAMSSTVFAATWEKPTITGQDPVNEGEYYIMNVEAQKFLNAGTVWFSWSTSAALDETGQVSKVAQQEDGTWTIARTSDGKYTFTSGNSKTGKQEMHVDGANPSYWNFNKTEAGYYNIVWTAAETEGTSWGWLGKDHQYKNAVYADITIGEGHTDWLFVAKEDKEAFATKLAIYNKAMELEAIIARAKEAGLDVTEEEAVYNNAESTLEELTAAVKSVEKKIVEAEAAKASLENPADFTSKITNATFDKAGDSTGWTDKDGKANSGWGAGGTTSTCAERYQMAFNTWQEIADVPVGVYKVNVDGFYRAGSAEDDFAAEKRNDTFNPAVYGANVVAGEVEDIATSHIMHLSHGIEPGAHLDKGGNDIGGMAVTVDGEQYYVPNSMLDFTNYNGTTKEMEKPFYKTNEVLFPVSEGKLRIGVKNDSSLGWTIVDNFGLTYYGNGADAWQALMENYKANAALGEDLMVTTSVAEQFASDVEAATATDYNSYKASADAIAASKAAVEENVAAWKEYVSIAAQAQKLIEDPQYAAIAIDLADYLMYDYADNIETLELSTEDIKAEIEVLKNLYEEAKLLTPPGTDVSGMMKNSDFAAGWDGWEHSGNGGAVAVNASAKCAEAWNSANFDIHQDVENAPVGVYEIQVQGFYRYLRGDNAWNEYFNEDGTKKTENVSDYITNTPAMIFCNDNTNPMANVFDYSVDPEYAEANWTKGIYYTDPLGEKCYPNNMTDAGNAFDLGQYKVSAFGLVAQKGDPLRVGIKGNSNQGGDSWAIFTRFKLTYQGYKAEIIKPELEKALAKINTDQLMGADVINEAIAAKTAGEAALVEGDGPAMFQALAAIFKVQDKVATSVALFASLVEKNEGLLEAIYNSEASDATNTAAAALNAEIAAALDSHSYTDADAQEAIKKIAAMIARLNIPADVEAAIAVATEENPADVTCFIQNASFETGTIDGWEVNPKATGDTNAHENSNDTYHFENAEDSYVFNTWNSSAVEDGFWLKQTVESELLPAGAYKLTCVVASDAGNKINVSVNEKAEEVIPQDIPADEAAGTEKVDAKKVGEYVEIPFSIAKAGDPIAIAVESMSWFKADGFHLYFYGANAAGIESVSAKNEDILSIFNVNGVKSNGIQKGVNIVITKDGAKKIVK